LPGHWGRIERKEGRKGKGKGGGGGGGLAPRS